MAKFPQKKHISNLIAQHKNNKVENKSWKMFEKYEIMRFSCSAEPSGTEQDQFQDNNHRSSEQNEKKQ